MSFKDRLKNYGLWVAIAAFVALMSNTYGWNIIPENYDMLINSFLGILVMLGIINNPTTDSKWYLDDISEIKK